MASDEIDKRERDRTGRGRAVDEFDEDELYDPAPGDRRSVVMRLLVFQLKLLADGIRDLLLSPISIAATVMGFVDRTKPPDHYFQQLLHLGRRSDVFIDLFDAHRDDAIKASSKAEEMAREAKRRFDEVEASRAESATGAASRNADEEPTKSR